MENLYFPELRFFIKETNIYNKACHSLIFRIWPLSQLVLLKKITLSTIKSEKTKTTAATNNRFYFLFRFLDKNERVFLLTDVTYRLYHINCKEDA